MHKKKFNVLSQIINEDNFVWYSVMDSELENWPFFQLKEQNRSLKNIFIRIVKDPQIELSQLKGSLKKITKKVLGKKSYDLIHSLSLVPALESILGDMEKEVNLRLKYGLPNHGDYIVFINNPEWPFDKHINKNNLYFDEISNYIRDFTVIHNFEKDLILTNYTKYNTLPKGLNPELPSNTVYRSHQYPNLCSAIEIEEQVEDGKWWSPDADELNEFFKCLKEKNIELVYSPKELYYQNRTWYFSKHFYSNLPTWLKAKTKIAKTRIRKKFESFFRKKKKNQLRKGSK